MMMMHISMGSMMMDKIMDISNVISAIWCSMSGTAREPDAA